MFIVRHRKFFYIFSALLIVASIVSLSVWGLKPGIDFTGGSLLEVTYAQRPAKADVVTALLPLNLGDVSVRETGDNGFIIRSRDLAPAEKDAVVVVLKTFVGTSTDAAAFAEKRFDSVGPILGKEALQKSWVSISMVLIAIVLFITFAFRKVSEPVSSWKYGLIAVIALLHDVIIPMGVFAVLGHFAGFEVDTLFITAILVVLGFSVHDTIVVFDRVRENLYHSRDSAKKTFETIVGQSVSETFVRSVNTSLTTILAIVALYLVGPESTKHFSLALMIGIASGTYSSIFIGSTLLVTAHKLKEKKRG
jgi:preprotein translocase subunit SecF